MTHRSSNKEGTPCERRDLILREGSYNPGIVFASKGAFMASVVGIDGRIKRALFYQAPSLFGQPIKEDLPERNLFTIKALSQGEYKIVNKCPDPDSSVDNSQLQFETAEKNDLHALTWQIAILRHNPTGLLDKRIRDTFNFLTNAGRRPTPPVSQEELSDFLGSSRVSVNRLIRHLEHSGALRRSLAVYGSYEIVPESLSDVFNPADFFSSGKKDIDFWGQFAPDIQTQMQLLEARQARTIEARFARGLILLTEERIYTPPITQGEFGRLIAVSRIRINQLISSWKSEGFLANGEIKGSYKLTREGKTFIQDNF